MAATHLWVVRPSTAGCTVSHAETADTSVPCLLFCHPTGGEIFDQIIRSGYMSEKVAAEKTGQLLSFLAHSHSKHVIHRWV